MGAEAKKVSDAAATKPEPGPDDWRQDEQIQHTNLLYFKSQQWYVTNYGFLLFGALLWLSKSFQVSHWFLPLLIGAAGAWVVGDLEAALDRARSMAKESRTKRGLATRDGGVPFVACFLVLSLAAGSYLVTRSLGADVCRSLVSALLVPPIGFVGSRLGNWTRK